MKRDLDYLREILLIIEEAEPNVTISNEDFFISTADKDQNTYLDAIASHHISMLLEEGFIELEGDPLYFGSTSYPTYYIHRITSAGYDYLDSVRDPSIWSEIKSKLGAMAQSVTLSTITSMSQEIIKAHLKF